MSTNLDLGPGDAKARRLVLVHRPGKLDVTGHLTFWPVPPSERKSTTRGARARVLLPSGGYISVDPSHVYPIDEGATP